MDGRRAFASGKPSEGWLYSVALDGPAAGMVFETRLGEIRLELITVTGVHPYRLNELRDVRIGGYRYDHNRRLSHPDR